MDAIEKLFKEANSLSVEIEALQASRQAVLQNIAELTCPFKVGDTIITDAGLGVNGLVVQEITPPIAPSKDNRWAVVTFALSKAGEITRRSVTLSELYNSNAKLKG